MKRVFGLTTLVFLTIPFAFGQAAVKAIEPGKPAPVVFHSELLDLTFTYPGSLIAEKLPSLDEQHAATAAKQPADENPEYKKTDDCTDAALVAKREDDPKKATGTIAFYEGKKPEITLTPIVTASLLVARVGVSCMSQEYRDHLDEVIAGFSPQAVAGDGLKPIDQPLWYKVGKTRIHLAAAQDVPADPKAAPRWVVGASFLSAGSMVTMLFESNDLPFLNEMLHGKIALGKEAPATFFPVEIGNGKPLKLKP